MKEYKSNTKKNKNKLIEKFETFRLNVDDSKAVFIDRIDSKNIAEIFGLTVSKKALNEFEIVANWQRLQELVNNGIIKVSLKHDVLIDKKDITLFEIKPK